MVLVLDYGDRLYSTSGCIRTLQTFYASQAFHGPLLDQEQTLDQADLIPHAKQIDSQST